MTPQKCEFHLQPNKVVVVLMQPLLVSLTFDPNNACLRFDNAAGKNCQPSVTKPLNTLSQRD